MLMRFLNRNEKLANALSKISVKWEQEDEETPASEHHTFKLSCCGTCRLQAFQLITDFTSHWARGLFSFLNAMGFHESVLLSLHIAHHRFASQRKENPRPVADREENRFLWLPHAAETAPLLLSQIIFSFNTSCFLRLALRMNFSTSLPNLQGGSAPAWLA